MTVKCLAIICFNRPELLKKTIASVLKAHNISEFKLVLVHQVGNSDVAEIVKNHENAFDLTIKILRDKESSTFNISRNRYLCYEVAFRILQSDYVIVLEDDVEIAPDTLDFANHAFEKYKTRRDFRGVNLGNGIPFSDKTQASYSLLRYSILGPASLMPLSTWNTFKIARLMKKSHNEIFDGTLEPFYQSGFVVTPNNSRYIDHGVIGTHSSGNPDDEYFKRLQRSWVGLDFEKTQEYSRVDMRPMWRADCKIYRRRSNPYYLIRYKMNYNSDKKLVFLTLQLLRRFKNLFPQTSHGESA